MAGIKAWLTCKNHPHVLAEEFGGACFICEEICGAVMFALGQAAAAAADEVREGCGESIAKRVFHAVKAVASTTIHTDEPPELPPHSSVGPGVPE